MKEQVATAIALLGLRFSGARVRATARYHSKKTAGLLPRAAEQL